MGELAGSTVVVTGGGAGLGAVVATELAAHGAHVVVADVDGAAARQVVELIAGDHGSGEAVTVDAADVEAMPGLVERAAARGDLHGWVNNAGGWGTAGRTFPEAEPAEWRAVLDLNLIAPMYATQLAAAAMTRGGAVVNVSSSAAIGTGAYGSPEYAVAKAGLIRLTTSLAGLAASRGVRVNCVVPGWIGLPRAYAEQAALSGPERIAAGRLIDPRELAGVVLRLLTDPTAAGQVVEVL